MEMSDEQQELLIDQLPAAERSEVKCNSNLHSLRAIKPVSLPKRTIKPSGR
jgi:hypothetical protein